MFGFGSHLDGCSSAPLEGQDTLSSPPLPTLFDLEVGSSAKRAVSSTSTQLAADNAPTCVFFSLHPEMLRQTQYEGFHCCCACTQLGRVV